MNEIPKETQSIKLLRKNIEELLMTTIQECFKRNKTPMSTYRYVDEVIDWCEGVGVYENGELRTIVIEKLGECIDAKTKEINK